MILAAPMQKQLRPSQDWLVWTIDKARLVRALFEQSIARLNGSSDDEDVLFIFLQ